MGLVLFDVDGSVGLTAGVSCSGRGRCFDAEFTGEVRQTFTGGLGVTLSWANILWNLPKTGIEGVEGLVRLGEMKGKFEDYVANIDLDAVCCATAVGAALFQSL